MSKTKFPFKNIWLFLPCHNEVENIKKLVTQIIELKIPNLKIVIINDNSTDNTGIIANNLKKQYKQNVYVLNRKPPRGRARAGKDAFIYCLNKKADVVIEMDADFSHDPKYIPVMLKELQQRNVDVVLGSRFLPGGSDSDRSPFRTFVSKISGIIFRNILGIKLTDMGSGFKAYKREALLSIKPKNLFSKKGLAISMESIFRVLKNNFTVLEIPIVFQDRQAGVSKLSWKDFFEPIGVSLKLVKHLGRHE